jgi:3'-5' exoribonuclease
VEGAENLPLLFLLLFYGFLIIFVFVEINHSQISGLPVGSKVDAWLVALTTITKTSVKRDPYLFINGMDIKGINVKATYFLKSPLAPFPDRSVVHITGTVGKPMETSTALFVYVDSACLITDQEAADQFYGLAMPSVPMEELTTIIDTLEKYSGCFSDTDILSISKELFAYYKPFLWKWPAAKQKHEPIRGGLAKHTFEVLSVLNNSVIMDKGLDRDVLFFSALYHDIGKTREYTDYITLTDEGMLSHHIAIGYDLIVTVARKLGIADDSSKLLHIRHCILSHHGQFSVVKPCTREAIALHFVDWMMAFVGQIDEQIRTGNISENGWGSFMPEIGIAPFVPQLKTRK